MNHQVVTYAGRRFEESRPWLWLVLGVTLVVITACSLFGRGARLGSEVQLEGEAVLNCSEVCAERGQCGATAEFGTVVLGGAAAPTVDLHDRLFPVASRVTIAGAESRILQPVAGGDPFPLMFYLVVDPAGKTGWVAGWCLASS